MFRPRIIPVLVLAPLWLAGCDRAVQRDAEASRFRQYLSRQAEVVKIEPQTPLTMAQTEEIALHNSLGLAVSRLALKVQDESVKLALSSGLPDASLNYSEAYRSNAALAKIEGGGTTPVADRTQRNLTVAAVAPVLDFGLTYYSYRIAVNRKAQDVLLIKRAEQTLRRDVRVAYTRHAGAIRQERLSSLALQASEEVLRAAKALEREQMTVPADTALVQAAVAEARVDLARLHSRVRQSHLVLSQLMSLGPEVAFSIDPGLPTLPAAPSLENVAAWEDLALARRPELFVQDLQLRNSANVVRREASAFFPQLDLTGSYNGSNNSQAVNPAFFLGGFQVTHSLLDGGRTIWRYSAARRQRDVEREQSLLVSLGVLYDVDFAALRAGELYETVQAAAALESSRRLALDSIISLYREGMQYEAGAAQSLAALTSQATALDLAQTEYLVAWHELDAAVLPDEPMAPLAASRPATAPAASQGLSMPQDFSSFLQRPSPSQPAQDLPVEEEKGNE
jgi:outer membrane protein TolC